jgi:hypothetical protein
MKGIRVDAGGDTGQNSPFRPNFKLPNIKRKLVLQVKR